MELGTKLLLNDVSDYQRVTCALARELRSEHCYTDYFFDSDDCALVRSNAILRLRVARRDSLTTTSSSSSAATTSTAVTPPDQQVTSASTTTAAAVPGRASLLDFLRVPVAHETSTTRAHTAPHTADGDTAADMAAATDADMAAAELVYKYGNTVSDGDQMSFVLKVTRLPPTLTRALLACAHGTRDGEDVDDVLTVLQAYVTQDSGDAQTLQSLRELLARLHATVNGNGKGNSVHPTPATAPHPLLHMGLVGSYSTTRRVYALPLSCDTHDTRCEQQQQHTTLPCASGEAASATLLVRVDKTVYRFKEHYELETLPHSDAMTDDKERVMAFLTSLTVKYTPAAESKFVRFVIGNASRRAPLTDVSDVKLRLTSVEGYTELRRNLCSRAAFTLRPWRRYHAGDNSDRGSMAPAAAHYAKTPRHARVRVPAYFTSDAVATTTADDNIAAAGGGGGGGRVFAGDMNDDDKNDGDDADDEDVVGDYNCRAHTLCTMRARPLAMHSSGLYKTHESGSGGSSNKTTASARDGADDRTGCCYQDKGSHSTSNNNNNNEDEDNVINSPHAGSMYSDTAGYNAAAGGGGVGGGTGAMPSSSSSTQCSEEVYDDYYYDGAHEELAQQCSYLRLRCFRSNPPTYELVLKTQQHFEAGHQDNSTCKMQLSEDVAAMLLGDTPSSFVATQLPHNSIAQTLHTALAVHELQHTVHFCTRRLKAPWWASRAQPCNNNNNNNNSTTMSAAAYDTPTPTTAARAAAATRTTATTTSSSLSNDDDNDQDVVLHTVSKASATAPQMQQQPQQLQPPRRPQRQPSIDAAVAGSAAEQRALAHGALTSSTLQCFASQPVAATCASGKRSRSEACAAPLLVHLDHTRFVRPRADARQENDSHTLAVDVVRAQEQQRWQQQPHAQAACMQTHVCDLYELEVTNIAPDTAPSDVMDELVAVLCSMGVEWQPGTESKLSYYYKLQQQQRQQLNMPFVQHTSTARVNSSSSTSRTQPYDYTPTRMAPCASTT